MGMFDIVKCAQPLPDGYEDDGRGFQTKAFDRRLDLFEITEDGRLVRTERDEDGEALSISEISFNGTFRFAAVEAPRAYAATFSNGALTSICAIDPDLVLLKPCPFCGAGETVFQDNGRVWTGMRYSDPVSVSVRHWCTGENGQPEAPSRMIERVGRDRLSAIAAWNRRAQ